MTDQFLRLFAVVAVGWAVTFGLRSLPFLLFAGRDRTLPPWVERLGVVISPVIIFGLILYSYAGLAWRTPWPYAAGLLTVALHMVWKSPLLSIIAGTALYMVLLAFLGGCASRPPLEMDAQHPAIRIATDGAYFRGERVDPTKIPGMLEDDDIPKTRTIHIRVESDVRDYSFPRFMMALLAKNGYKRSVLVTERHAESKALGRKKPKSIVPRAVK